MNWTQQAIIWAHNMGYEATRDGRIISHLGNERALTKRCSSNGKAHGNYLRFSVSFKVDGKKKTFAVPVHQFVAYQKFGDQVFNPDLETRHLNNNDQDNSWDNIGIGTRSENEMDKEPKTRFEAARNANRKYTDDEIRHMIEDRRSGMSLKKLMHKYGVSSTGTMSYILNKSASSQNARNNEAMGKGYLKNQANGGGNT